MQNILVTGAAGFVGSHLCEVLLGQGHSVIGLDDFSSGKEENIALLQEAQGFAFRRGSILSDTDVASVMGGVDLVIHLAAYVGVMRVLKDPVRTFNVNFDGTRIIADGAAARGIPLLYVSSSEVYGPKAESPQNETMPVTFLIDSSGRSSYPVSKAAGEQYVCGMAVSGRLQTRVIRLFNVVGRRQQAYGGSVLPRLIQQAISGEPLTVFGAGEQVRTFGDVRDIALAMSQVAQLPYVDSIDILNLGGDQTIGISALAELIRTATGSESEIVRVPYAEAYGISSYDDFLHRQADLGRLYKRTSWRPRYSLRDTIASLLHD